MKAKLVILLPVILALTPFPAGAAVRYVNLANLNSTPLTNFATTVISVDENHTLALRRDDSLWAWGANGGGRLGIERIGGYTNQAARVDQCVWSAIGAGHGRTFAIRKDGSLWAWGRGVAAPVRIGDENDWGAPPSVTGPAALRITGSALQTDGWLYLFFATTLPDSYYLLQRGDSPPNIQLTVDATLGDCDPRVLTDPAPVSSRASAFYRIRAVPLAQPLDSDGDGIDDVYELRHRIALNPLNPSDAAQDFDGDGRSNLQEYHEGTDPTQVRQVIAAGLNYAVALKTDGSLWSWGENAAGQLGDGTYDYGEAPVRVGNDTDWIGVSVGRTRYAALGFAGHTVGLKRNGSLWSWGDNHQCQLGAGIPEESTNRPVRVGLDNDWSQAAAGSDYTLALKRDGSLWGWGGSGAVIPECCGQSVPPIRIGHSYDWQAVAAGGQHALALKTDGSLWAWGNGNVGQLGLGQDVFPGNEPTRVGTDNDWTAIAASGDEYEYFGGHSLALKADGSLWSWGLNEWGQLGLGSTGQLTSQFSPARIGKDMDWAAIAASNAHSLARKRDGSLWLWGFAVADHPVRIGTNEEWTAFTVGGMPYSYLPGFALTLTPDGSLWSWSLQPSRNIPTLVGNDADWATVSGGSDHTLALTTNGVLKAWGANGSGQVGDRTIGTNRFSPILIDPVADWSAISAGPAHSLALRADGSLWTWGFSFYLQLCNGEFGVQLSPVRIGTASDWMRVAAGDSHSVALKNDGSLWSWGCNTSGQLGDGTTNGQSAPVRIDTDNDWVDFSTRNAHTVALKSDGSLWAWGANGGGQLTPTNLNTPVRIGSDNDWTAVSAGYGHTLGLKSNGSLWAWGQNYDGQLGDGTTMDRSSPVRIGTGNDWVSISAGSRHNLGLKTNGTLWTWGWNAYAQLGDSTLATRTHPTQIGFDTDWTAIAAGSVHSLARKTDGTLWSWGLNDSGQLGFPADLTPHRVGTDTDWGAPP